MVKKFVGGSGERGKVRVRFFEIEMEGETETLQDSVRALTAALNKPASPRVGAALTSSKNAPRILDSSDEEGIDEVPAEQEEDEEIASPQSSAKPARQRAKRTPPTPKVLEDFSFDDVSPSWPEFASSKSPDSDVSKVAVAATWFKRHKATDTININHAYTAFKYVDWPTPDDIGQAFRNAKRANNWFGTDGDGNWTINIIGLNAVDKLKKSESAKN